MCARRQSRCSMQSLYAAVHWRTALSIVLIIWIASCSGQDGTIPPASCSFTLFPSSASHAASGGTGSVTVTTTASCSWTARSDSSWVTVTGGSSGRGSDSVTYRVDANTDTAARTASILVADACGQSAAVSHRVSQAAAARLTLHGAYVFVMEVDPDGKCEWPVAKFYWPVLIKDISYEGGTAFGSIVFPPLQVTQSNTWSISASPTRTQLVPRPESPGPADGAYDVVVDGGSWEAGGLIRARDGRGQITSGTASGARLILLQRSSGRRWECRLDAKWSLLIRFVDRD